MFWSSFNQKQLIRSLWQVLQPQCCRWVDEVLRVAATRAAWRGRKNLSVGYSLTSGRMEQDEQ